MAQEVSSPINRKSNAVPLSPGAKSNRVARVPMQRQQGTASLSQCKKRPTRDTARNPLRGRLECLVPKSNPVGRGWRRVRGTSPNEQCWEYVPYDATVEQADPNAPGNDQLKHAKQQIALAQQYPGRERSLPSGAKVIELDAGKRSPKA